MSTSRIVRAVALSMICVNSSHCYAAMNAPQSLDRKEGCAANFTCSTDAPEECDRCSGYGYLSWTKSYTNCSGGTSSDVDCDDKSWNLAWGYYFCSVPANQTTFDVDLDVTTYGAVFQESCDADDEPYGCHWDVTVHRQHEAVKVGSWTPDKHIAKMIAGTADVQAANLTYTLTVSTKLAVTTGWTFSFNAGAQKAAVEAAIGGGYSYSTTHEKEYTNGITWTSSAGDVGKYIGGFGECDREKIDVDYSEFGCSGRVSGPTRGTAYRTFDPLLVFKFGATSAAVLNQQENEGLVSVITSASLSQ